ncbi:DUF4402 domain-containing protein [Erythrobacter sp.]|uniref:DUF4402 domain-containing protein n=1 Tax=Erythrobacter sp. TaxID=1042 RepID=UPI00311DFBA9
MKKIAFGIAVFAAVAAVPASAAGASATTDGDAAAEIVAPIAILHQRATLHFGTLVVGSIGGTVVVDDQGNASSSPDITHVPGVTPTADVFTVSGEPGRNFSFVTEAGKVSGPAGSTDMGFTTSAALGGTLDNLTGTFDINVGGELTVNGSQTPGSYVGTYRVTAAYN